MNCIIKSLYLYVKDMNRAIDFYVRLASIMNTFWNYLKIKCNKDFG